MNRRISGAELRNQGVGFSLWAPAAKRVGVVIDGAETALAAEAGGWFATEIPGAGVGTRYAFRIDGETSVPDPASAFQPDDVAGPSEVIDHSAYKWRAADWKGRPWHETILLETHVGTFTGAGTYRAMIEKLDEVSASGFTAIELMPLADFPGRRNWGYDGVLWYAPDSIYGRPEDLKALIDEAHLRGLMVFLDVVYNHFGPEGNYLGLYAPDFFMDAQTPWGSAIDYSRQEVLDFAVENAVRWLRDYRFDGLRLDAVHAIVDRERLLTELSRAAGALAEETGRLIHLVLENDDNQASLLEPAQNPPKGKYRAQWNDDYHHAWHTLLTGEHEGYYSDYAAESAGHLARTLGSGFAFQGEPSPHRAGVKRGEPSGTVSPLAFVNFLQNHDQIGNRALGERLDALAPSAAIAAALAITLIAPTIPMLFMGEEWGAQTPFPFFCDFEGNLAQAIRNGRRREFAAAYARYGDDVPDPLAEETFRAATLKWDTAGSEAAKARRALVMRLIEIRKEHIWPRLSEARFATATSDASGGALTARWTLSGKESLALYANLSDAPISLEVRSGRPLFGKAASQMPPWAVAWQIETDA